MEGMVDAAMLDVMEAAAHGAIDVLQRVHATSRSWTKFNSSGEREIASDVDVHVEEYLRKRLGQEYPNWAFLSEETNSDPNLLQSERCFVVDPIDGIAAISKRMQRVLYF